MNRDEFIVNEYLKTLNYNSIEYEPNGNIPPDFLLDNKIAVEARRLNQHIKVNGMDKPEEELYFKLVPRISKIIKEFECKEFQNTLIVSISYGRPLKINRNLLNLIRKTIKDNLATKDKNLRIPINDSLEIRFFRSDLKLSNSIILGVTSDYDSGGYVVSNIYNNLKLIISEKEQKISRYFDDFSGWWLALVDYIGYGLDELDIEQLNNLPKIVTVFDKILIVSPSDIRKTKEINFKNASA